MIAQQLSISASKQSCQSQLEESDYDNRSVFEGQQNEADLINRIAQLSVSNRMLKAQLEEEKRNSDYKVSYTQKQAEKRLNAELSKVSIKHMQEKEEFEMKVADLSDRCTDLER